MDKEKLAEQTYDNLQGELDQIETELEKNPDNEKLISYGRQSAEIMLDILDRLDGKTMSRSEAQEVGAKTLGGNPAGQERYYNSRGEMYNSREEAIASEER